MMPRTMKDDMGMMGTYMTRMTRTMKDDMGMMGTYMTRMTRTMVGDNKKTMGCNKG
jgi:hypothetical protein